MPVVTTASLNAYDPVCTVNLCLGQVAGQVDFNPEAQYSACVSMFGSPVVTTITPTDVIVLATETSTVSYTDIIVSLTTQDSTVVDTATAAPEVIQTSYTNTVVDVITTTVTAATAPPTPPARKRKVGRRCAAGRSTMSSSTETPSSTASSSSVLFPIASNCPSLEAYSSACACISAVATTQTVMASASTSTSIIPATVSTEILSTSVSSVLVLETSTVTVTSPVVSTLLTDTTTTTTLTVTTTPVAPTQTAEVILSGTSEVEGKTILLWLSNQWLTYLTYAGTGVGSGPATFIFKTGQQPAWADNPTQLLWADLGTNALTFYNGDGNDVGMTPITCDIGAGNTVTCQDSSGTLSTIYDCTDSLVIQIPGLGPDWHCDPVTWTIAQ